jgi:Asp-tRNA(Asn)/Glu-tRNA(Gln) amidotransferase A subunit family amidase
MASMSLDTVGWYGRCVEDLLLVAEAFWLARADEVEAIEPKGLRVGLCRSPVWPHIEPAGEAALLLAARRLEDAGAIVEDLELPPPSEALHDAHTDLRYAEAGPSFLPEYLGAYELFAQDLRERTENRRGITSARLLEATTLADRYRPIFDGLFGPSLDVVLTPSAAGEAPEGLHTTGSAVFNAIWTLLHVPCVNIPITFGPRGLPIGITLVGPRHSDARLLAISRALAPILDTDPTAGLRMLC